MKLQISQDYKYIYIQNDDGSIEGTPMNQLTDEDKEFVYGALEWRNKTNQ